MTRRIAMVLWLAAALGGGAAARAQTTQPDTSPAATQPAASQPAALPGVTELSAAEVRAELQQAAGADLEEPQKAKLTELLNQALAALDSAEEWNKRARQYQAQRESAPGQLGEVQAELNQSVVPLPSETAQATLAQLEAALARAKDELAELNKSAAALEAATKARPLRRAEIPRQRADINQQLERLTAEAAPAPDDPPALARARRTLQAARRAALTAESAAYGEELRAYDATDALLVAQQDLLNRKVTEVEARLQSLQALVAEKRVVEAERLRSAAEQEARSAALGRYPITRALADRNVELANKLKQAIERTTELETQNSGMQESAVQLKKRIADVREKVQRVGLTTAIGYLLRKQREQLPNLNEYRALLRRLETDIADVTFESLERIDERRALADLDKAVQDELLRSEPPVTPADREPIEEELRAKLETRRATLDQLTEQDRKYAQALGEAYINAKDLVDVTEQAAAFINEHVLWIRSAPVLNPLEYRSFLQGPVWLADGTAWEQALHAVVAGARHDPTAPALGVAALLALGLVRVRIRRRLGELATATRARYFADIRPTLAALVLTVVLALFWPAVLAYVGWQVEYFGDLPAQARGLAIALRQAAVLLAPFELLRWVCCRDGLGEAHFGWQPAAVQRLRGALRRAVLFMTPLAVIGMTLRSHTDEETSASFGRLCFLAVRIYLTWFLHRLLRPTGGLFYALNPGAPTALERRLRYLWYTVIVGTSVALAILSIAGFVFSAAELARSLHFSLTVLLALVITQAVVIRWLELTQRRLALEQARLRREAARAAVAESASAAGEVAPVPVEEELVDVPHVAEQTQRLVRTILVFAGLFALWAIWVEMLPALSVLRRVQVWGDVSVASLLLGAALLLLTILGAKNIPGLLEIAILQRLPIGAAARYAVTTLSRYVITIAGVVSAFGAVGIGWDKVQWLAAAITFGLGFGLQEIFANFVSGLILLFDRPIRIGDVVTVGDVTGTVTRIRIRATTIMDGDRKEMIIPNKQFITGSVVNWTLTDPTLRVAVRIGVNYGADISTVKKLLVQVARANPLALPDPAPAAMFTNFGANSLDFELSFFVARVADAGVARDQVNTAIDEAFRAAGIEIAFPQRDIHLRTTEPIEIIATNRPSAAALRSGPGGG